MRDSRVNQIISLLQLEINLGKCPRDECASLSGCPAMQCWGEVQEQDGSSRWRPTVKHPRSISW